MKVPSTCLTSAFVIALSSVSLAQPAPAEPPTPPTPPAPDTGAPAPDAPPVPETPPTPPTSSMMPPPSTTTAPAAVEEPPPAAPPKAAEEEEVSPLVPPGEAERMSARPIKPKVTFKAGKGLVIGSEDGDFEIGVKIRGQILGTFEFEHDVDDDTDGCDGCLDGAQIRRARVSFQGNMFGKHNKYKFELAVSPRDAATRNGTVGTAPLLDWYMTFDRYKAATVVVGQYKVPFNRQRVVSSGSLQMVDRSIVQSEFNLDRNIGFDVRSTNLLDKKLHYYLGFYPGEARNSFQVQALNHLYLARVEVLPLGAFHDYIEGDFERTGPRLSIGASYAYNKDSARAQGPLGSVPADQGLTSFHVVEADVLFKAHGLSVTGELFVRNGSREGPYADDPMGMPIPVDDPRNGLGYFGQAGYLLPHSSLELTGRFGEIRKASKDTSLKDRHELGGGVSYYFAQHSYKLQADYFRLWEDEVAMGTDVVRVQLEAGL